jgi:uncharacterized protein YkwD
MSFLRTAIRALLLVTTTGLALAGTLAAPASAATLDGSESDLLGAINSFRASKGLSTLVVSDTLTVAAKWMATDMSVNNYFGHTSLDGRTPQQRMGDAGYPAYANWTGENIAAGYTVANDVLNGWINSPGHYAVLTNPNYRAIGIGRAYAAGSTYQWYWDADFGGAIDGASPAAAPARVMDIGFHAAWSTQSPDPTLSAGQSTTLVVALRNTGYRGWYKGSPGQQANLGTADPLDVARPELASNWLSPSRVATTTTDYVGPGQVGWFQFAVHAPSTPGVYVLRVRGVVDGTTWLEDPGIFFTITVR